MTLLDVIRNGVQEIANVSQSPVVPNKDATGFAFPTPAGLCLIGVSALSEDQDYIDIRWRVFIGQITPTFDYRQALEINHHDPETPYGVANVDGTEILTITDTYRFLLSWGPEKIRRIIVMRFGGAFMAPLALNGVAPIPSNSMMGILQKYGCDQLLGTGRR